MCMQDAPAVVEARQLMSHRHNAASTWSLCVGGTFEERVHDSFNSIGQMFILTVCGAVRTETKAEFKDLFDALFQCQEEFYVWYDGSEKAYDEGVVKFQTFRAVLGSSVAKLSRFPDRLGTVSQLQQDIDEIVGAIRTEMAARLQTTTGAADTATQHALLEMENLVANL